MVQWGPNRKVWGGPRLIMEPGMCEGSGGPSGKGVTKVGVPSFDAVAMTEVVAEGVRNSPPVIAAVLQIVLASKLKVGQAARWRHSVGWCSWGQAPRELKPSRKAGFPTTWEQRKESALLILLLPPRCDLEPLEQ